MRRKRLLGQTVRNREGLSVQDVKRSATTFTESWKGSVMRISSKMLSRFRTDEDGAALIEYTVLLGILLVAVIATIILVGGWISNQWAILNSALPP